MQPHSHSWRWAPFRACLAYSGFFLLASSLQFGAEPTPARRFIAADLPDVRGLAVDAQGILYVTEARTVTVHRLTPAGDDTVLPTRAIKGPFGVAVDMHGLVYVSDDHHNAVYRLGADGTPTSIVTAGDPAGLDDATTLAVDEAGDVFVGDNHHHVVRRITPDGTLATFAGHLGDVGATDGVAANARFGGPRGIAIDHAGNLYVADEMEQTIRKITPRAVVTTLAGQVRKRGHRDGPGSAALFSAPRGIAVDRAGVVYVADTDNQVIRRIMPDGTVSTYAGQPDQPGFVDGPRTRARFHEPRALAIDADDDIFVADTANAAIREITPDGNVTTVVAAHRP